MNRKICLIHYHYISSHMNTNYSGTVVNMSKIHPCQILFRLMMKVGVASLGSCELLRVADTVCGRPLAHMPAPLSTLLTLPTLATPWCTSPPPSAALCTRIIFQQKRRRRRWSRRREGSPPPPSCLSCLFLCSYLGCLHPLCLQSLAWWYKETPSWQR